MLTVTTAAEDLQLLTIEELRAAAGVTGNAADAALTAIGLQIAHVIAAACGVVPGGTTPPTLRQEVLEEAFRLRSCTDGLWLARRPVVSVASVVEAGITLDAEAYESDGGRLDRLSSGAETTWPAGRIVVAYTAGWATVPDDLKLAAGKMVALTRSQATRDPLARSERIRTEGVEEIQTDYWVGPINAAALPSDVVDLLRPYDRNRFAW